MRLRHYLAAGGMAVAIGGSYYLSTTGGVGGYKPSVPSAPPGLATIWVGNPGPCLPASTPIAYDPAKSCSSLSAAYSKLTSASQNILFAPGSYAGDEVDANTALGTPASNVNMGIAAGATVTYTGPLSFGGTSCGCLSQAPPNHITLDGAGGTLIFRTSAASSWTGGIRENYYSVGNTRATDIALRNLTVFNGDRLDSGDGITLNNTLRSTIDNVTINGACCGSLVKATGFSACDINVNGACSANSPIGLRVALRAAGANPNPDQITVTHSTIRYIMRDCANWPTALYGACPGGDVRDGTLISSGTACATYRTSGGGTDSCHVDGTQWYGGQNITFTDNKIYGVDVQALFFGDANGGTFQGTNLIAHNFLQPVGGTCGFCVSVGSHANAFGGDWTIQQNTTNADLRFSWLTSAQPGTVIRYLGNIGHIANSNGGSASCTGGTNITWTYAYNVDDLFSGGAGPCDATDKTWTSDGTGVLPGTLVVDGSQAPSSTADYHLVSGAVAGSNALTDMIPAGTSWCAGGTDIDGQSTPLGAGCEPGADELPSAFSGGASTAICSPSPCTQGTAVSKSISVADSNGADAKTVSYNYWITRPNNLANSSSNLAPLLVLFAGSTGETDTAGFRANSALDKYVIVTIPPIHTGQYAAPTTSPNPTGIGSQNCGLSGTNTCDDSPWIQAVLQRIVCSGASPCENIDPNKVYAAGGSKGGSMALNSICDTRTSSYFTAINAASAAFISPSFSNDQTAAAYCPALLGTSNGFGGAAGLAANTDVSVQMMFGDNDGTFCAAAPTTTCLNIGYLDAQGRWHWGDPQIAGDSNPPSPSTGAGSGVMIGRRLGCSGTPSTVTDYGATTLLHKKIYTGCTRSYRATETILVHTGGHSYPGLDGRDSFSSADEAWNFFVTYGGR